MAFINIAMTLALLSLYVRNYRNIKSPFTMGLVLFAALFVATNQAIVALWLFRFTSALAVAVAQQAFAYMFVVNLGEALALASLLRVTWK